VGAHFGCAAADRAAGERAHRLEKPHLSQVLDLLSVFASILSRYLNL
jgi:hypothetical protein